MPTSEPPHSPRQQPRSHAEPRSIIDTLSGTQSGAKFVGEGMAGCCAWHAVASNGCPLPQSLCISHLVTLLSVSSSLPTPPKCAPAAHARPIFFPGLNSRLDMTVGDALRKPGFWLRFFQVRRLPAAMMLDASLQRNCAKRGCARAFVREFEVPRGRECSLSQ